MEQIPGVHVGPREVVSDCFKQHFVPLLHWWLNGLSPCRDVRQEHVQTHDA